MKNKIVKAINTLSQRGLFAQGLSSPFMLK